MKKGENKELLIRKGENCYFSYSNIIQVLEALTVDASRDIFEIRYRQMEKESRGQKLVEAETFFARFLKKERERGTSCTLFKKTSKMWPLKCNKTAKLRIHPLDLLTTPSTPLKRICTKDAGFVSESKRIE
jgi:hypothetical protein